MKRKRFFICKGKDASAQGEYTDEGFVVLKNSVCNLIESQTVGPTIGNIRKELIENGTLVVDGKVLSFTENYIFNSPSAAPGNVLARRRTAG
ncbi:DUF4357 domain-containing protein [Oceanobacillus damuensis]|uniref:DUF4357 domain-containing protein n=1 Tax=Oceanobacillus damuensis TaxID=937928 RepID=UPI000835EFA3|nr:DUF4357 domain-containing protein [Oceanobacillus damuensis]